MRRHTSDAIPTCDITLLLATPLPRLSSCYLLYMTPLRFSALGAAFSCGTRTCISGGQFSVSFLILYLYWSSHSCVCLLSERASIPVYWWRACSYFCLFFFFRRGFSTTGQNGSGRSTGNWLVGRDGALGWDSGGLLFFALSCNASVLFRLAIGRSSALKKLVATCFISVAIYLCAWLFICGLVVSGDLYLWSGLVWCVRACFRYYLERVREGKGRISIHGPKQAGVLTELID